MFNRNMKKVLSAVIAITIAMPLTIWPTPVSQAAGPCMAPVADLVDFDFKESMTDDKSPRNVDGTAYGNPQLVYEPTLGKNVLSLNGNSQFIMIPDSDDLDVTGPFTMLVQFSTNSLTGEKGLFGKTQSGGYGLEVNPNKIETWNYIGGAYRKLASPPIEANKFYDAAVVYTGSQHILYVNGQVVSSEARTGAVSTNNVPLAIGTDPQTATTGQLHFSGKIGYAKMFNKGLTAAELQCYYDQTGIMADHQVPLWGTDSSLTGEQTGQTDFKVNWTAASDDKAITQYRIYRNGKLISTVAGDQYSYSFHDVLPGETASFKIEAGDAAGNWTTDGPALQYVMPGALWPDSESLTITPVGTTSVKLTWPAAFNEQIITLYRVYLDGSVVSTLSSAEHQLTLQALPPGTTHTVEVEAGTASGIWGKVRLIDTFTMPGFDIIAPVGMSPDLLNLSFEQTVIEDESSLHNEVSTVQEPNLYFHPDFNNKVLDMDGSTYARIPHQEALSPSFLTIATSFMIDDLYRNQTLIGKTNQSDYALEFNPITKKLEAWFLIRRTNGQESYVIVESNEKITTQQVYYATATYDGSTAKLYVNGALAGSKSLSGVIGGESKVDLLIGANTAGNVVGNNFDGKLGFVHLYSKVLDAAGVKDLYDQMTSEAPTTVSSIRWEMSTEMFSGKTAQSKVFLVAADGTERVAESGIRYESLTPKIATVTQKGSVTALQPGTAVLKASFEGVSTTVSMTVKNRVPQSLTIIGPALVRTYEEADLSLYMNYDNGDSEKLNSDMIYSSNAPAVVSISPEGHLTALQEGKAIIHAEYMGMNADLRVQVVNDNVPVITSLHINGPMNLHIGQKASTVVSAVYSDQSEVEVTGDVRFESENPSVASIDAVSGEIEAIQAGTTYISALVQGYEVGYSLTVQQPELESVTITGGSNVIRQGESLNLKAEATYSDHSVVDITDLAEWRVASESLLKMNTPGNFSALMPGKTVIEASYNDLNTYYDLTIEPSPSDNGNTSGGNGSSNSNGNGNGSSSGNEGVIVPGGVVITAADITNGNKSYQLNTDEVSVIFPINTGSLLGEKSFRLQGSTVRFDLPSNLFKSAAEQVVAGAEAGATLYWSMATVSATEINKWLIQANANLPDSVKIKVASEAKTITFSLKDGNSKSTPISFAQPVHALFAVNPDVNKSLLGVYQVLSNGNMKYIGGKVTADGIEAELPLNGTYVVMAYEQQYKDVGATHWALDAIQTLTAKRIIEGTSEDYFQPSRSITRAEFVALLVRTLHIPLQRSSQFSDVSEDAWYVSYVGAAANAGLVKGQQNAIFAPNASITREEMTVLLARAYNGLKEVDQAVDVPNYKDAAKLSAWSVSAVQQMSSIGIVNGVGNGNFEPQRTSTRAESAQIIMNMMNAWGGVVK